MTAADGTPHLDHLHQRLDAWLALAQDRSGWDHPRLVVPECNAPDPAQRPAFFTAVAGWLAANGGKRLCTFWKLSGEGNLGGPWLPDDQATIAALNDITRSYG